MFGGTPTLEDPYFLHGAAIPLMLWSPILCVTRPAAPQLGQPFSETLDVMSLVTLTTFLTLTKYHVQALETKQEILPMYSQCVKV